MSAVILQFTPRPRRGRQPNDTPNAFRSRAVPDDLTMDHADTAPCECIGRGEEQRGADEPA